MPHAHIDNRDKKLAKPTKRILVSAYLARFALRHASYHFPIHLFAHSQPS